MLILLRRQSQGMETRRLKSIFSPSWLRVRATWRGGRLRFSASAPQIPGATVVGTLTPDKLAFVVPTFLAIPTAPPRAGADCESDLAAQYCNCAATCWGFYVTRADGHEHFYCYWISSNCD
ncbi:hypothetical protein PAPYR_12999 [Paratrimastix pyriformis]|uniref:Uncharacterized protein n=1 Tax=Paratrimastix pyriformis TaxID=342808 RepID=A0ABQ8U3E7_9EUKA|nr:hypothetical protein PAPYR_12999 [Paratrimastix pyriformis]